MGIVSKARVISYVLIRTFRRSILGVGTHLCNVAIHLVTRRRRRAASGGSDKLLVCQNALKV